MENFLGLNPQMFTVNLPGAWLGPVIDSLEVEIKADKESLGWLYLDSRLIFFSYKNDIYESSIGKIKELTEEKLKEKKFSDTPKINCLSKSDEGRIITLISVDDLLGISSKVVVQEG